MPPPLDLLASMRVIASDALWLAVLWHVVLVVALLAFLGGWRPSRRTAAMLLVLPVASVVVVAAIYGNPFNTLMFAGLGFGLFRAASRIEPRAITRPLDWEIVLGHAVLAFGIAYPHFLDDRSPLIYAIAAPFGTLPCPTLAVLVGFTLLAGGFSRAWNFTLVIFAVFYGTVGTVQLGVWIDVILVLGAISLAYLAARLRDTPGQRTLSRQRSSP